MSHFDNCRGEVRCFRVKNPNRSQVRTNQILYQFGCLHGQIGSLYSLGNVAMIDCESILCNLRGKCI
jgi:hypothetical protein